MAVVLVPSLSLFNIARLQEELSVIRKSGLESVHVEVCDGHWAPDLTVGQPVVECLRKEAGLDICVHLRAERPERFVKDFAEAGASAITINLESTNRLWDTLKDIRHRGCLAGVALNQATPIELAYSVLSEIDILLLLYGRSGSRAAPAEKPASNPKASADFDIGTRVEAAAELRRLSGCRFAIGAVGELNLEQIRQAAEAAADFFVAGGPRCWTGNTAEVLEKTIIFTKGLVRE